MAFTVKGTIAGDSVVVTWNDGRLETTAAAARYLERYAEALDGRPVGPVEGPVTMRDHLADPLSALFVLTEALGPGALVAGNFPTREPIPRGAIG